MLVHFIHRRLSTQIPKELLEHNLPSMALIAPAQTFTLPDQRVLSYAIYGSPDAKAVVFYHHGFPSSRDEALLYHEAAQRHNIRLISPDRPGMGLSTYQSNRCLLDWPSDLLKLADHLGIEKFAVLGVSGGSPYTLACWHQLPRSRCIGAGIASGLYPASLGLDGMMLGGRVLLYLGAWSPWLVGAGLNFGVGIAAQNPERLHKLMNQDFQSRPAPDRDVWNADRNHVQEAMKRSLKECFRNGGQGAGWEAKLFGSDWGFKLEEISIQPGRVLLWHGSDDVNCPLKLAEKGSQLLTGAELRVAEGECHLSLLIRKENEIMESLSKMLSTEG